MGLVRLRVRRGAFDPCESRRRATASTEYEFLRRTSGPEAVDRGETYERPP